MQLGGREVPAWVVVAGVAGVAVAAVAWAQYRHGAQLRDAAPDWLRAGQPPDVAVWQLPAALSAAQGASRGAPEGARTRTYAPAWVPMTGGEPPAWTWAGDADMDGPQ